MPCAKLGNLMKKINVCKFNVDLQKVSSVKGDLELTETLLNSLSLKFSHIISLT